MTNMVPVPICGRQDWTIFMPEERAARVQWPWHEWNRFHSMFHNLRPGDVLFDIGAEQGDQSALYQRWIQRPKWDDVIGKKWLGVTTDDRSVREGGIVLVEPNPVAWANIKAVWEANDLRDPLFTVEAFVGREVCGELDRHETVFPPCAEFQMARYVGTATMNEQSDVVTIDALAGQAPSPDAITIDIEGGELDALRGAARTLLEHKPLVWVSVHWQLLEERGQSRQELLDYMTSLGYHYQHLGADHEEHLICWHPYGRNPVLPYDSVAGL